MIDVNILGTKYTIHFKNVDQDVKLDEMEGYTDFYAKEIVICNLSTREYFKDDTKEKIEKITKKILRHELIHTFLFESGLDCNSNRSYSWADNEEMVDWIAIQSPKIYELFNELDLLGDN